MTSTRKIPSAKHNDGLQRKVILLWRCAILTKFYYNTLRKSVAAFGTLFNDISIDRVNDAGDVLKTINVPLQFVTKEKFVHIIEQTSSVDNQTENTTLKQITLPRMGFELTDINYAPERHTNKMNKIIDKRASQAKMMYNRVPFDVNFSLFIATRKIDDSLRIVEQIAPYFTPEFTIKIQDKDDFGISTNVPVVLNGITPEFEADGGFDTVRTILWSLQFTMKTHLYAATRDVGLIKKSTVTLNDLETTEQMLQIDYAINPLTAGEDDTYTIDKTIS